MVYPSNVELLDNSVPADYRLSKLRIEKIFGDFDLHWKKTKTKLKEQLTYVFFTTFKNLLNILWRLKWRKGQNINSKFRCFKFSNVLYTQFSGTPVQDPEFHQFQFQIIWNIDVIRKPTHFVWNNSVESFLRNFIFKIFL